MQLDVALEETESAASAPGASLVTVVPSGIVIRTGGGSSPSSEDRIVGQAATPASTATINKSTIWLMGTVVFKSAAPQFSQAVVSPDDQSALGANDAGTFRRARVVKGPGGTSYYCRMGA